MLYVLQCLDSGVASEGIGLLLGIVCSLVALVSGCCCNCSSNCVTKNHTSGGITWWWRSGGFQDDVLEHGIFEPILRKLKRMTPFW
jgi:hypothetical protein